VERAKAFSPYRRSQRLSWLIAVWHSLELTRSSQDRRLNPARRIRLYCANLTGGLASHLLVRRIGLKWGRCGLGMLGLAVAACCTSSRIDVVMSCQNSSVCTSMISSSAARTIGMAAFSSSAPAISLTSSSRAPGAAVLPPAE
jgi:hypothetical protein